MKLSYNYQFDKFFEIFLQKEPNKKWLINFTNSHQK